MNRLHHVVVFESSFIKKVRIGPNHHCCTVLLLRFDYCYCHRRGVVSLNQQRRARETASVYDREWTCECRHAADCSKSRGIFKLAAAYVEGLTVALRVLAIDSETDMAPLNSRGRQDVIVTLLKPTALARRYTQRSRTS